MSEAGRFWVPPAWKGKLPQESKHLQEAAEQVDAILVDDQGNPITNDTGEPFILTVGVQANQQPRVTVGAGVEEEKSVDERPLTREILDLKLQVSQTSIDAKLTDVRADIRVIGEKLDAYAGAARHQQDTLLEAIRIQAAASIESAHARHAGLEQQTALWRAESERRVDALQEAVQKFESGLDKKFEGYNGKVELAYRAFDSYDKTLKAGFTALAFTVALLAASGFLRSCVDSTSHPTPSATVQPANGLGQVVSPDAGASE